MFSDRVVHLASDGVASGIVAHGVYANPMFEWGRQRYNASFLVKDGVCFVPVPSALPLTVGFHLRHHTPERFRSGLAAAWINSRTGARTWVSASGAGCRRPNSLTWYELIELFGDQAQDVTNFLKHPSKIGEPFAVSPDGLVNTVDGILADRFEVVIRPGGVNCTDFMLALEPPIRFQLMPWRSFVKKFGPFKKKDFYQII